jgi:hypothetical protein
MGEIIGGEVAVLSESLTGHGDDAVKRGETIEADVFGKGEGNIDKAFQVRFDGWRKQY